LVLEKEFKDEHRGGLMGAGLLMGKKAKAK
jgi:hypothetical protein